MLCPRGNVRGQHPTVLLAAIPLCPCSHTCPSIQRQVTQFSGLCPVEGPPASWSNRRLNDKCTASPKAVYKVGGDDHSEHGGHTTHAARLPARASTLPEPTPQLPARANSPPSPRMQTPACTPAREGTPSLSRAGCPSPLGKSRTLADLRVYLQGAWGGPSVGKQCLGTSEAWGLTSSGPSGHRLFCLPAWGSAGNTINSKLRGPPGSASVDSVSEED